MRPPPMVASTLFRFGQIDNFDIKVGICRGCLGVCSRVLLAGCVHVELYHLRGMDYFFLPGQGFKVID